LEDVCGQTAFGEHNNTIIRYGGTDGTITNGERVKAKNLEFYLITDGYAGPKVCHMLIVDYRRPSTLEDFPFLKGIEDENTFGRANFIKVIFISEQELDGQLKEEL
jgi:hypothetical protein